MAFGDFTSICEKTPLPLCPLVGPDSPITGGHFTQSDCYARSIEVANTIIFEGAAGFAHILVLIMLVIMILHVRSKFTAVGRKEITSFFYAYTLLTMCSLVIDCGVVPPASGAYPYFVAVQLGFVSATAISLMINGFVGFQLYEDGTTLSVWLLRTCSVAMFLISFAVSLLTFKGWGGLGPENTVGVFVVVYIFSALFLFVYVVMQVILVLGTLDERWPLWHIGFGVFAFVIGQVLLYAFSETICNNVDHYLDGLFFATLLNLLAVMMVYKYWDFITREDLEFSVGQKQNNWEVKDPTPVYEDYDKRGTYYQESEYGGSPYHQTGVRRASGSIY
ncbi:Chitin synthase export chaperone [Lecanosticta acicola]|uniref:Chitin synthase export chaperone n=1 Tax=Lecanosticta acicola TaxID=111012 RepID=A0AAI9EFB5_9PEZI|nr:Chitin synthase export chaperone [Lecanosticta acicola]